MQASTKLQLALPLPHLCHKEYILYAVYVLHTAIGRVVTLDFDIELCVWSAAEKSGMCKKPKKKSRLQVHVAQLRVSVWVGEGGAAMEGGGQGALSAVGTPALARWPPAPMPGELCAH